MSIHDFTKAKIYCFDLYQYQRCKHILVNVFANYNGKTYISKDIKLTTNCCDWDGTRWVLPVYLNDVYVLGLISIIREFKKGTETYL